MNSTYRLLLQSQEQAGAHVVHRKVIRATQVYRSASGVDSRDRAHEDLTSSRYGHLNRSSSDRGETFGLKAVIEDYRTALSCP